MNETDRTAIPTRALVLLGQVLELSARSRTGAAIRALLGLAPTLARRVHQTAASNMWRSPT
jgi:cation transport ATPase